MLDSECAVMCVHEGMDLCVCIHVQAYLQCVQTELGQRVVCVYPPPCTPGASIYSMQYGHMHVCILT